MTCADLHQHPGYTLTWLPEVLRAAGLPVIEEPGWQTRGHGDVGKIVGVLCHHTASAPTGNEPSLGTVTHGRPDLAGPLAQLLLGRDGTWYLIAAGKCWHAGAGAWHGFTDGNSQFIGIEAENNGVGEPWPNQQVISYAKGVAAILHHIGQPAYMCAGHKEYALPRGRKMDPDFDMAAFRARVGSYLDALQTSTAAPIEAFPLPAHADASKPGTAPLAPRIAANPQSKPAPMGLIQGEPVMATTTTATTAATSILAKLNVPSLAVMAAAIGYLVHPATDLYSTNGIVAVVALIVGYLIQMLIPAGAGAAVATIEAAAPAVLTAAEGIAPGFRVEFEAIKAALAELQKLQAAQQTPAPAANGS